MSEIWKPIPMLPEFEASDLGRVRDVKGRVRSATREKGPTRYPRIEVMHRRYLVHVLVANAFLGPRPDGLVHNHKNGDKFDSRPENLEYVTSSENLQHAYDVLHRKGPEGERHGLAKLTEQQVREIYTRRDRGVPARVLAAEFNVSYYTVWDIYKGNIWRHLGLTA